jgi:hypothetical protein
MMYSRRSKAGPVLALVAAIALLGAATDAFAQRQMTRLGNPATRFTPPVNTVAALQKTFKAKRTQAAVGTVLDKAGLASLTPQVLAALTEGKVTETSVAPGTAIRWMALKRGGKPDILLDAVWAGKQPFKAYAFTIEDGAKIYNFVVPKVCGNLTLVSQTEQPMPECIRITMARDCATKQVTFTAGGTAISNNQATVVKVLRDGRQVGELLPASGFKGTFPLQPGRYTFMATDKYGREFGTCERDYVVEACAAPAPPPPPPPPAATSCGALVTAVKGKGGWDFNVDASASGQGASPAAKGVLQIIGPDGKSVSFVYEGKPQTEVTLSAPFTATFLVPKAKPGTYTIQAKATAANPVAAPRSCEATVVVPEPTGMNWFADGAFGKQRRQYELAAAAPSTATIAPGFCDPMLGVKFGPMIYFNDGKASFAPAAGIAFMFGGLGDYDYGDNKYNNSSVLLEGVVNYHFGEKQAYIGTGIGLWDLFDGDHFTVSWIANFGYPMGQDSRGNKIYFIAEGRLFFDAPNGIDNNYQMWGGLRYVFGGR